MKSNASWLALQIVGMVPNLPKILGLKTLQKRKIETTSDKSVRTRVEPLPASPTSKTKESEPQAIGDFQIVQVQHDSSSLILKEGQRSPIEYLFNKAILSLSAPDVSDLFPEKEPTEAVETSGTAPTRVQLKASTLEDYVLACKAFSNFLYPTNAAKLLSKPLKTKRQKALDYFIQVS